MFIWPRLLAVRVRDGCAARDGRRGSRARSATPSTPLARRRSKLLSVIPGGRVGRTPRPPSEVSRHRFVEALFADAFAGNTLDARTAGPTPSRSAAGNDRRRQPARGPETRAYTFRLRGRPKSESSTAPASRYATRRSSPTVGESGTRPDSPARRRSARPPAPDARTTLSQDNSNLP